MITILLITLGAILVPAFILLLGNTLHAPEGYEDATGFHVGKEPVLVPKHRKPVKRRQTREVAHPIDMHVPAA